MPRAGKCLAAVMAVQARSVLEFTVARRWRMLASTACALVRHVTPPYRTPPCSAKPAAIRTHVPWPGMAQRMPTACASTVKRILGVDASPYPWYTGATLTSVTNSHFLWRLWHSRYHHARNRIFRRQRCTRNWSLPRICPCLGLDILGELCRHECEPPSLCTFHQFGRMCCTCMRLYLLVS